MLAMLRQTTSKLSPHLTLLRSMSAKVESEGTTFHKDDLPPQFIELLPLSRYGGETTVTLITGSTIIGSQGAKYIKNLIDTAKVPITFEHIAVDPTTSMLDVTTSLMRNRHAIHVDLQYDPKEKHKSLMLNNSLDLFATVIKMFTVPGYRAKQKDVDITLIAQNNTGDYTKLEYEPRPGVIETLKTSLDSSIERYMKYVFDYACKYEHERITFAHKVNELPLTDGRFLDIAKAVHEKGYQHIDIQMKPIDALTRNIIMNPTKFDIIATNDRYGTVLASICSAVCGGASLFSATDMGEHHALFKPLQTKLSLTDARVLSPYGIVRSVIDLLLRLGNNECAAIMEKELLNTMLKKQIKTEEFGGINSGDYVICDIVNNLRCRFQ